MRNSFLILGVGILLAVSVVLRVRAADNANTDAGTMPNADFLAAGLHHVEDANGGALDLTFDFWAKNTTGAPFYHYHYVRSPEVIHLISTGKSWKYDESYNRITDEYRLLETYLATGVSLGVTNTGLNTSRLQMIANNWTPDVCIIPVFGTPLCDWVGRGKVADVQENIDGHGCFRVDLPKISVDGIGLATGGTVWLDPTIGLCPRRLIESWLSGYSVQHDFYEYSDLGGGVWVPFREILTVSRGNGTSFEQRTVVTEAHTGMAVNLRDNTVQFPEGTRVVAAAALDDPNTPPVDFSKPSD